MPLILGLQLVMQVEYSLTEAYIYQDISLDKWPYEKKIFQAGSVYIIFWSFSI
jgi:hypothetical protein